MSSLREAFQEFDDLDDIYYDIDNKEDIEKLKKSLESDEDDVEDIEKIVDLDAENEEDLKDSYVGELLLYCPSCHTIHYRKKEEVIEDEENPEVVNVGEQCPHCDSIEGFEIIGQVAPYDETENDVEETEIEDETEFDEFDLTAEDDLEDEENFKENLKSGKQKSFLQRMLENDMSPSNIDENGDPLELDGDDDTIEERVGSVLPKVKKQVKENKALKENLTEAPVYGLEPRYDSRKSFYGKAQVDTGDKNDQNRLYSYDTLVAEIKDGKPVVYGTYSQTTLRHIKDWLKQNGFKAETSKQIMNDYGVKDENLKESKKDWIRVKQDDAWYIIDDSNGKEIDGPFDTLKETEDAGYGHLEYIAPRRDESCKTNECNLNEEVQDEAYEIAEYVYDVFQDRANGEPYTMYRDEFEEQVAMACRELYGIDNVYENVDEAGNVEINGKSFDIDELLEGDIRGILGYKGVATDFSSGDLTTKEIEENLTEDSERDNLRATIKAQNHAKRQPSLKLVKKDPKKDDKECKGDGCKKEIKESKSLKESAQDVYADILDRAKMNIDADYDIDEAIWDAIDNGLIYTADEFAVIRDLFSASDLYTADGEPVSTIIMEHIFNEIYGEVSDYYDEKHNDIEVDESLKSQKRTVEQIKESIKTKLDKTIKEGLDKSKDDIEARADDKKEIAKEKEEKAIDDADADKDDELDEELFDNLINKYCTRVYENVDNYKTTGGYTQDHKLVLEGILTYKSGNTANTKFVFEKKIEKDGKVKYVGLNESFSKSKRAFSLNCRLEDKKIISESLSYNYNVKVNDSKKVVYGNIKNN